MFDRKLFIEVSEETIVIRRMERNGPEAWEYTANCVVPNYVRFRPQLIRKAEVGIDGDDDPLNVMHRVKRTVEDCC